MHARSNIIFFCGDHILCVTTNAHCAGILARCTWPKWRGVRNANEAKNLVILFSSSTGESLNRIPTISIENWRERAVKSVFSVVRGTRENGLISTWFLLRRSPAVLCTVVVYDGTERCRTQQKTLPGRWDSFRNHFSFFSPAPFSRIRAQLIPETAAERVIFFIYYFFF